MKKEIVGKWIEKNGEIEADSNCQMIENMVQNELKVIETSEDGWTKRLEGKDGKIWELTYPEGHLQNGGPPKLTRIEE